MEIIWKTKGVECMAARQPVYQLVYKNVKQDIMEGRYAVGDKLPSESEMQAMYNVSRTTVRKAVEMLANDGFVYIKQGKGTIVIDHTIKQSYNKMNSFTQTLRGMGYAVSLKNLSISRAFADATVAKCLEVEVGHELACIQRIPLADEHPAAIITNYIPYERVQGIEQHENEIVSLYSFLEAQYGLIVDSAHDAITARTATFEQSCILGCPLGAPMLYTRRVCYAGGKPVCYDLVYALAQIGGYTDGKKPIPYEIEIYLTGKSKFDE